jgi:hypothetical protein
MPKVKRELTSKISNQRMEPPAKQRTHFGKIRSGAEIVEPSPDAAGIVGAILPRELLTIVELAGKASIWKDDIHNTATASVNPKG